jgi:hypothetical protein
VAFVWFNYTCTTRLPSATTISKIEIFKMLLERKVFEGENAFSEPGTEVEEEVKPLT